MAQWMPVGHGHTTREMRDQPRVSGSHGSSGSWYKEAHARPHLEGKAGIFCTQRAIQLQLSTTAVLSLVRRDPARPTIVLVVFASYLLFSSLIS
ncbi:hypothetical protein L211DRAFT_280144 [Terfezia boudieri ATCC MYA-4762]|uniref:Uncharacterized protein n=1 Tax=Terfezia boudieri ATCC MYA-4762 TaxID=1051890 RepID=A0A3N4LPL7_9PEZI|nr:hypothetical protein L211DRAFT_280144 [Terfezia boudieri ATCC MYA-4762]